MMLWLQWLKSGLPAKEHNYQIMYSREGYQLVWELMVLNQIHLHQVFVNFLAESGCVCVWAVDIHVTICLSFVHHQCAINSNHFTIPIPSVFGNVSQIPSIFHS